MNDSNGGSVSIAQCGKTNHSSSAESQWTDFLTDSHMQTTDVAVKYTFLYIVCEIFDALFIPHNML